MAQALDQVTYPVNGSGKDGLEKAPKLGTPLVDSRLELLAGPCLSASLTCSSTRASLVWRVRFVTLPHFLIWLKAFWGEKRLVFRPCRWNRVGENLFRL